MQALSMLSLLIIHIILAQCCHDRLAWDIAISLSIFNVNIALLNYIICLRLFAARKGSQIGISLKFFFNKCCNMIYFAEVFPEISLEILLGKNDDTRVRPLPT